MSKELIIPQKYATITEAKDLPRNNTDGVRVYRYSPYTVALQIRTFKPTNENQTGKPRNMIAQVNLHAEGIRDLIEYLKPYAEKLQKEEAYRRG